jgi:hypothetical protein
LSGCLFWSGLVWSGLVWSGLVWSGLFCFGLFPGIQDKTGKTGKRPQIKLKFRLLFVWYGMYTRTGKTT